MIRNLSTDKKVTIFIVLLLLVDQIVKFIVKLNMALYESIPVFGHWFQIDFVENPGAAFGMQLGGEWGKLLLSLIRIAAIVLIAWYTHRLIHRSAPKGVIVGFALILAGAIGNMIDSAFYGLIFSESTPHAVATLFPEGGGYASFLHGKVVDMLYFPIISGETWSLSQMSSSRISSRSSPAPTSPMSRWWSGVIWLQKCERLRSPATNPAWNSGYFAALCTQEGVMPSRSSPAASSTPPGCSIANDTLRTG